MIAQDILNLFSASSLFVVSWMTARTLERPKSALAVLPRLHDD